MLTAALATLALGACNADRDTRETVPTETPRAGVETPTPTPVPTAADAPVGPEEEAAASGALQSAIPARFHGTYGASLEDCAMKSHSRFTVSAQKIQFIESSAEVLNVRAESDYAAVTADETYADTTTRYVFYMALEGGDRLRYRYDKNERMTWVRCP
ncbi:hypothetical protein [Erythrobacter donghaensis]|uniref:hypothetical protein n=1 Tax=Erythrobacter donghaensis TaxID=267135 RepID=UPI001302844D|nr:hypothetical protein [Erythrobacter donghaensis]